MPPILYFFALCNLVIGSGAFVLGGILQPISASLGVSMTCWRSLRENPKL